MKNSHLNILFIRAAMSASAGKDAMEPLIFAIIDSVTPDDVHVIYVDDRTTDVPLHPNVDLVAISTETFAAARAYGLSQHYQSLGIPTALGGFHPSTCPDEAEAHANTILIGDAEDTWPQLISDLRNGTLQTRYQSTMTHPLKPLSNRHTILKLHKKLPLGLIETSRGCTWSCHFCSIHAMYGHCQRAKAPKDIAEELKHIPQRILFLTDDNIYRNDGSFEPLLDTLKASGKKWACQISMNALKEDATLDRLRDSGCIMLLIGFETLNTQNLTHMKKGANHAPLLKDTQAEYETLVSRIYARNMMIYATFVIGYPGDTPETFDALFDWCQKMGFTLANFNPLIPMPGTALYEELERKGRLTHPNWWLDPTYTYGKTTFIPEGMTAEALEAGCFRLRERFYHPRNVRKRKKVHPIHRRPLGNFVYTLGNTISRKEIKTKQGKRLTPQ